MHKPQIQGSVYVQVTLCVDIVIETPVSQRYAVHSDSETDRAHFKLLHPSQVPVWGLPGQAKLEKSSGQEDRRTSYIRAPSRREQPLERRPQREPPRERANAAIRSRVLDQPQRDRRQPATTEEDERRIIRELANDLDIRRKRM